MILAIQLKSILQAYHLDKHGIYKIIADEIRIHRQTIAKMYHGEHQKISLEVLGLVSKWLIENGVPASILPGALLGAAADDLWTAATKRRVVTVYIGAHKQLGFSFISSRDANVLKLIVQ